jgi:hypothetical protein
MNQVTYKNRYKDIITFTHEGDTVTMQGGRWIRWAFEDDGTIIMVDPSGGPYIELGNNLAHFWPKGEYKDLIVESITVGDHDENDGTVVTFKIKL